MHAADQDRLGHEGIEILDEGECRALLATVKVGRVGVCVGAMPAIFPVNFVLDGEGVVFRTAEGTKLNVATNHAVVAFQCDDFDDFDHTGWSVLVVGMARVVTDAAEAERLRRLPLRPWAAGPRERFVRVPFELVSGRRIVHY